MKNCPDCGSLLLPGPKGGVAQNFYCTDREACREGFNVTIWQGQLLAWERIGEVDDQRFALYAKE